MDNLLDFPKFANHTSNMPKSTETPRDLRKKLTRSTASRDSQKEKLRIAQYEIKKIKNCLSAMTISRDKWRLESKADKIRIKNLENELSDTVQNRDELLAKLEYNSLTLKKKSN
jgi:hypothetical protein